MKHHEMIESSRERIDAAKKRIAESREIQRTPVTEEPKIGKVLRFPVQAARRERVNNLASRITREELPAEYLLVLDTLLQLLDWIATGARGGAGLFILACWIMNI